LNICTLFLTRPMADWDSQPQRPAECCLSAVGSVTTVQSPYCTSTAHLPLYFNAPPPSQSPLLSISSLPSPIPGHTPLSRILKGTLYCSWYTAAGGGLGIRDRLAGDLLTILRVFACANTLDMLFGTLIILVQWTCRPNPPVPVYPSL